MELYKEILIQVLKNSEVTITFGNGSFDGQKIVESVCYQTLLKIKRIIEDESNEDSDCFDKIEEIVCAFEEIGSGGGSRHDFG